MAASQLPSPIEKPGQAGLLHAPSPRPGSGAAAQSACFLKNAGMSMSSIPLFDSASTLAAAWLRASGTFKPIEKVALTARASAQSDRAAKSPSNGSSRRMSGQ